MLDTNHYKNSSCAFAEQIVAYLYDEANPQEKTDFESHLANCENCADELSGFGFVRNSVQQWRTAEFLPMQTPAIEIPFEKSTEILTNKPEKISWLAGLRRLFTLNPLRMAASALAILAVCAGLTFFVYNFSGNTEIAVNTNNPVKETKLELIEQPKKLESEEIAQENLPDESADISNLQPEVKNPIKAVPQTSVEKISNNTKQTPKSKTIARNANNSASVPKVKNVNKINQASVAKNEKMLKLADFEEIEDNSLRLMDLMAEVDDK